MISNLKFTFDSINNGACCINVVLATLNYMVLSINQRLHWVAQAI